MGQSLAVLIIILVISRYMIMLENLEFIFGIKDLTFVFGAY